MKSDSAPKTDLRRVVLILLAALILLGAWIVRSPRYHQRLEHSDVYYIHQEGERVLSGVNPYLRIIGSDMVKNDKYATYLPLTYFWAAAIAWLRPEGFESWLDLWRMPILLADLGMVLALIIIPWRRGCPLVGLLGGAMWAFGRWSLYNWEIASTEPAVLLSMIAALALWRRHPRWAGLLLGLSLSIKHIGVLLLPVLLLLPGETWRRRFERAGWTLALPLLISLPHLIWSPEAFGMSMLFSATREGVAYLPDGGDSMTPSMILTDHGLAARIGLWAIFPLLWVTALRCRMDLWSLAFLAFTLFVALNPVLFTQYFSWPYAFIPLLVAEKLSPSSAPANGAKGQLLCGERSGADPSG